MKQSYSEEANSGLPIQLFRNPKGQIHIAKVPVLCQTNSVHRLRIEYYEINFNIILRPMTNVRNGLLSPGLYSYSPTDIFYSLFYHISRK